MAWTPGPTPSSSGLGQTSSLTGTRSMGITSGVFPSLFSQASNPSRRVNTQRGSARHRPYTGASPGPFLSTNIPVGPRQFVLAFIPYAVRASSSLFLSTRSDEDYSLKQLLILTISTIQRCAFTVKLCTPFLNASGITIYSAQSLCNPQIFGNKSIRTYALL